MTLAYLVQELGTLSHDSKRKYPELKEAADASIDMIRSFKQRVPIQELVKFESFVDPFLLSIQTRSLKLVNTGLACLQKLIIESAIADTKLESLVNSLLVCSQFKSDDVHLKILQLLSLLLQSYPIRLKNELLSKFLFVCSNLYTQSKSPAIINTASATYLQLLTGVFDKIKIEDSKISPDDPVYTVSLDDNKTIEVRQCAYDSQRILLDLINLIQHQKPIFLKTNSISEEFGLELLETILKDNSELFNEHLELEYLLRIKISPLILDYLTSSDEFPIMVRVARIIQLMLLQHFTTLKNESKPILSTLTFQLTKDSNSPFWKKVLSLEIYLSIVKDFTLVQQIHKTYDSQLDSNEKTVFKSFFDVCFEIVVLNKSLLNTGDTILPKFISREYQKPADFAGLTVAKSSSKVLFIDYLDKLEPPQTSSTYMLYLILQTLTSMCDSLSKAVIGLDKNSSSYIEIKDLVSNNWVLWKDMATVFLYSSLCETLFNGLTKSLQKLTLTVSFLDLKDARKKLLFLICKSITNLTGSSGFRSKSLGESIVGTISTTIQTLSQQPVSNVSTSIQPYSRSFNSRMAVLFRMLINLVISLGNLLDGSEWILIFKTIQWLDYFLNGASSDKLLPQDKPSADLISSQEILSIQDSIVKLEDSVSGYNSTTLSLIIESFVTLTTELLLEEGGSKVPFEENDDLTLRTSSYNKLFFVGKLTNILQNNTIQLLATANGVWDYTLEFYKSIIQQRTLDDQTRFLITDSFDSVVKKIAADGFTNDEIRNTEHVVLNSLNKIDTSLSNLPTSKELLIVNCETDIRLRVLKTLSTVLNRYGSNFAESWSLVYTLLDAPFQLIEKTVLEDPILLKDPQLRINVGQLLESNFETVKLLLDEFLTSLPKKQLKPLIDILCKFFYQTLDLNISLNSLSYFWLISDSLKNSFNATKDSSYVGENLDLVLNDKEDLTTLINSPSTDPALIDHLIWICLIISLNKAASDPRAQVRNGAISTCFSIIDSHGSLLGCWKLIYRLVIEKEFYTIDYSDSLDSDHLESITLILRGLCSLYSSQFLSFDSSDSKNTKSLLLFWEGLFGYFEKLLKLNWLDLEYQIFKQFQELSKQGLEHEIPTELKELFYSFWSTYQILYQVNPLAQDTLVVYFESFDSIYKMVSPIQDVQKMERILAILNTAIRYPILPSTRSSDSIKSTKLQETVLNILGYMEFDDYHYKSMLIQQLANISMLPLAPKSAIEQKFIKKVQDSGFQVPTYIHFSHKAIIVLENKLADLSPAKVLDLGSFTERLFEQLLTIVQERSVGLEETEQELWMIASRILVDLSQKLLQSYDSSLEYLSMLFIRLTDTILSYYGKNSLYERFDIVQYDKLYACLIPPLTEMPKSVQVEFAHSIWKNSFLYEFDDTETALIGLDELKDIPAQQSLCSRLLSFPFDTIANTTSPIQTHPRKNLSLRCLNDLIDLCSDPQFQKVVTPFFISRTAIALHRVIVCKSLLDRRPLPRLQHLEIETIINGISSLVQKNGDRNIQDQIHELKPLFLRYVPFTDERDLQKVLSLSE
ncbi:Endocytosis and vacuole integrity protein [Komagataella phaffii CBS 7435]|uniref:Peripheral membrane protein with a role in endocytosis and vacuole integrity, interacts with Arl1p a n=2 Tax=Komagataella phaffii TaxID=460519 RepID=C4QZJ3_KOMPG|nr:Peripheral membrane protein with a role in endocytosis and vacuole integrity, interacts with Arl1p a [Komagataella phaffii GS115]AOA62128.1 GQ67_00089T0 [Komagataella phaffii]CAH2448838.1 Endocytosis and vacuole integrity protein [Komagataella phaffii CBS 7435]AOA67189.1 GQ68_01298T0 [Komagataella phaffii GS115]CAY68667.1 Peripheral membrane protein with a role in endocytosis and vacuole integrity, interacts with Arl1p a [Komagataella phaffii GS115]CCA38919.1 Endocytosis and vacuole integri